MLKQGKALTRVRNYIFNYILPPPPPPQSVVILGLCQMEQSWSWRRNFTFSFLTNLSLGQGQSSQAHLTFWTDWIRVGLLCSVTEKIGRQRDFHWTMMHDLALFDHLNSFCMCLFIIYGASPFEGFLAMDSVQGRSGWQRGMPCKPCTMQRPLLSFVSGRQGCLGTVWSKLEHSI